MDAQLQITDLKHIIQRRYRLFLKVFSIILLGSIIIALILPPIYQSTASIRIVQQQVSSDLVNTTITGYANERLTLISESVLGYDKLNQIINQLDLYPELRDKATTGELVSKMRKSIELQTNQSSISTGRGNNVMSITTSFSLSYEGKQPEKVMRTTNNLASLFIEEDVRSREELATATTSFFEEELDDLKVQIQQHEENIRKFKEAHIGELPEYEAMNIRAIEQLKKELDRIPIKVRTLEERKIYIKGQLMTVDPLMPIKTDQGKMVSNPAERLKRYRLELMNLKATLSEKHPDIIKLRNMIAELESQVTASEEGADKIKRLGALKADLATAKGIFGPQHPDVLKLQKEIDVLSKEVDEQLARSDEMDRVKDEISDNPLYINLMMQIKTIDSEIEGLLELKKQIEEDIEEYQKRIGKAPLVEREYSELTRDYASAKRKYNELLNKLLEAQMAHGLEESQRGERFSITSLGILPDTPYKPNRIAIILLGCMLGFAVGTGLATLMEVTDSTIKTADELNILSGVSVFSIIPAIESEKEKHSRQIRRVVWSAASIIFIGVLLLVVNQFIRPLNIIWLQIQDRIAMF